MDDSTTFVNDWYRALRGYAHYGQPGGIALCNRIRRIPLDARRIDEGDYNAKCCHCTNAQARWARKEG